MPNFAWSTDQTDSRLKLKKKTTLKSLNDKLRVLKQKAETLRTDYRSKYLWGQLAKPVGLKKWVRETCPVLFYHSTWVNC